MGIIISPVPKRPQVNWDIQGILLVSLLIISCAYAVLESVTVPAIPIRHSRPIPLFISITAVAVTAVLIRKYSELRQFHEEKAQKLRAKIEELNDKLGNMDEMDENGTLTTDEALAQKKEWGKIFDSIHDWVCLIDLNSIILQTNRVGETYAGLTVKEIIGQRCCKLVHGTETPLAECPLPRMLATGKRESIELQIKDGRWMLISVDPLFDGQGNMIKAIHIARDISNRKLAEMEKEKLEAISRQLQKTDSLGRMAGAIAHHFNNQLMIVMGNLELAIENVAQTEKISDKLAAALQATRRASTVSGLMLTYLGQTSDKHELLDLSEVCRKCLPILRAVIPHQLSLKTELPSPGPRIRGNMNQIQQALTNLINNAWESCDTFGAISVSLKTLSAANIPPSDRYPIDWLPQNRIYASLEVRDTGCGITDRDIEKIFDPFFSSKFPGRGLGLSVVLGIARAHQGAVAVESRPGRGSLFRIFLPVSNERVPFGTTASAARPDDTPVFNSSKTQVMGICGTALIVEDEEPIRKVTRAMLARMGITVLEAGDGNEAVKVFEKHKDEICCVLCDLTMPGMDGWETLAALRKRAPHIPVILASGYDEGEVMTGTHHEQPHAFLQKPFSLKDLSAKVLQVWPNREASGED